MHGIEVAILLVVWVVKAISDATAKSRVKKPPTYTPPASTISRPPLPGTPAQPPASYQQQNSQQRVNPSQFRTQPPANPSPLAGPPRPIQGNAARAPQQFGAPRPVQQPPAAGSAAANLAIERQRSD